MKQRKVGIQAAIALAALLSAVTSWADDRAKTDKTQTDKTQTDKAQVDRATIDKSEIIGNRELPKVLYIVPWKKPAAGELSGPPVESVLDEALAPIDRDVFRRQVHYDTLMHPAVTASPARGADTPGPAAGRN
jgi:hypothetical protein